ncbi:MAG TPA: hypothetical protein VHF06_18500 [Pseudonocardiaceae bacterium]|jgi:hypothetical protein|nr:hypothetical protein [Pseudonocardiaceae bacterium]
MIVPVDRAAPVHIVINARPENLRGRRSTMTGSATSADRTGVDERSGETRVP